MSDPACNACGGDDGYLRNTGTEVLCGRCMAVHERAYQAGQADMLASAPSISDDESYRLGVAHERARVVSVVEKLEAQARTARECARALDIHDLMGSARMYESANQIDAMVSTLRGDADHARPDSAVKT